jgi:Zn-dependent oligopeptidase
MYAKMAASHIWAENFAEDPFSRTAGMKLWDSMLRHGVSKPPKEMLQDLCGGGDVQPKHYFKSITGQ